ncbi:MAG: glyoxalase [Frankiaceae bacterium]|nr:glyoxalase [Frankiaceae bacterium]MBV9872550.1 glyoxalase [Frankiaceae bacterium]
MGAPIVHFEIAGKDGAALTTFYAELFGWNVNADNPMNYGIVERTDNVNADGIGIGGGISGLPEGTPGYITVYAEVPDVEAALQKAEGLGATRLMGPEQVAEGVQIGMFADPEGRPFGVIKAAS